MPVERTLGSRKKTWCWVAASLVSVAVVIRVGLVLLSDWKRMPGWEAYWIAQALVAGNGYSFPFDIPWPLDPIGNGGFHPSAWVDPLYTVTLAGLIRLFGSHHQLAAILNLGLLLAVFGLTYRLRERLISPVAGLTAVLLLALNRPFSLNVLYMNNTLRAATFVLLSALMVVRFLAAPSSRRAAALGLVLGVTLLACPGAQLFIPVAAVAVVVWGWRQRGPAVRQAIVLVVLAGVIVSPWAIRNYMALGEFVPGRTGLGQIAFAGVAAAGSTVAPDKLPAQLTPLWRAETTRSAVKQALQSAEKREALDRLTDYSNAAGPEKLKELRNEGYVIVLTTGRVQSNIFGVLEKLRAMNLEFDQILRDLPIGPRHLINDFTEQEVRAIAHAVTRDTGIKNVEIL